MHWRKRVRPTRGSTAERGSSNSCMSAREYAARASASRAFCPPAPKKPFNCPIVPYHISCWTMQALLLLCQQCERSQGNFLGEDCECD